MLCIGAGWEEGCMGSQLAFILFCFVFLGFFVLFCFVFAFKHFLGAGARDTVLVTTLIACGH